MGASHVAWWCLISTVPVCTALSWSNWAHNQNFQVSAIVNATTEADVAAILANNTRVKVIGAGHSFSAIDGQFSYGVMLNLVPPADPVSRIDATTVRAHAGLHLWELNALLESRWGLGLLNLGAIANQTIGGATATNTHGTGPTTGLSGFITAFTIVLSNGTVLECNTNSNVDIFTAGRVGYGALGIITWFSLTVVPLWRMERLLAPFTLTTLLTMLPSLRDRYPRMQYYWTPYNDSSAMLLIRTNVSSTTPVTGCWGGATYTSDFLTPPPVGMATWPAGTTACVDVSYRAMTAPADGAILYTEMEMMVDEKDLPAMLDDYIAYQNSVRDSWNSTAAPRLFTGIRYVAGDDISLSPFVGRASTAVISMIIYGTATEAADHETVYLFHSGLQAIAMGNYSGRAHPGKNAYLTLDLMQAAYPDTFSGFAALRLALDPAAKLINGMIQLIFGGC